MIRAINNAIEPLRMLAYKIGEPLFDLGIRLYMAFLFSKVGLLRLNDYLNGNFDSQIFLFDLEHPVPYLDPEIAAYITMGGELLFPLLIAIGLFARFGAAGILAMTAVIEFTYIHSDTHILWAILAGSTFIRGPGVLSLDHIIVKHLNN